MDIVGVSLVGGAIANQGGHLDDGGLVGHSLGVGNSLADAIVVMVAILHVQHVPAQALIALQHILSEGDLGVAVDGDLVVIIQHDELAQTPVAGQGGGLVGQALHHAAITSNAVGVVVHDLGGVGLVEAGSQVGLSDSQAHSIAHTLAQGAGGDLHTVGDEVLGVAGGLAAHLAEALQIIHRHAVVAVQVQQAVLEHGSVASGQHEAVPVEPLRVLGVVLHDLVVQDVAHGCAAHGHTGVPTLGLVHTINGQEADGVHALLHDLLGHSGWVGDGSSAHILAQGALLAARNGLGGHRGAGCALHTAVHHLLLSGFEDCLHFSEV
mmetsp:Transcript_21639/g.60016  ORF Transcript_21639/g.60016 Transcript_21639/m.60016 type:complete len:323 (+) Transcript_21639:1807-2775(+)